MSASGRIRDAISRALQAQLVAAAERTMPAAVRQKVRADLLDNLRLTSFIPHPDVADAEIKGHQTLEFCIVLGPQTLFQVDGKSYTPTGSTGRCISARPTNGRSRQGPIRLSATPSIST